VRVDNDRVSCIAEWGLACGLPFHDDGHLDEQALAAPTVLACFGHCRHLKGSKHRAATPCDLITRMEIGPMNGAELGVRFRLMLVTKEKAFPD
jgi:hypothetical protein